MRLLAPSPGECADRQSILALKIKFGSRGENAYLSEEDSKDTEVGEYFRDVLKDAPPINIQPFIDENEMIQRHLEKNWLVSLDASKGLKYDTLFEELAEINLQVWKLTDQAHVLKDAPDRHQEQANKRAAEVLFLITELNDRRAQLVREINMLFEINTVEKIFA